MSGAAATRGAFILFEGVDRCGKTTQARRLVDALNAGGGARAVFMNFPDRATAIGQQINAYLQQTEELDDRAVHLLFSANRWEKRCGRRGGGTPLGGARQLAPSGSSRSLSHPRALPPRRASALLLKTLLAGTHVVMDRYAFSGVAFSAAKPNMPLDWCAAPDAGLPAPDALLFMDLPAAAQAARGGFGGERYERADVQAAVRAAFAALKARAPPGLAWVDVDAAGSVEEVAARVAQAAAAPLAAAPHAPLRALWDGAALA